MLLQVILPLLKSDLFNILMKCVNGELSQSDVVFSTERTAVGVVLASRGYPASFPTGFTITGRLIMMMIIIIMHEYYLGAVKSKRTARAPYKIKINMSCGVG